MSDRYDDFLASRTPVRLRRGASADEIPAIGVEALLATKLTRRGDKAKDLFDVTQLLAALADAGRSVDLEKVRRLVPEPHPLGVGAHDQGDLRPAHERPLPVHEGRVGAR